MSQTEARPLPTRWSLFTAFLKIGVLGFGGVAALARHVLVVERKFLDEREFAELFGVASALPGANTVNMATMLGDRTRGITGAIAAVFGLMGAPLIVLIIIATLYERVSEIAAVKAGMAGAAAAAAGLVIGTSLKILKGLGPDAVTILTVVLVALGAAVIKAPMPLILIVAVPVTLALGFARWRSRA